jgi:hypothetical protein
METESRGRMRSHWVIVGTTGDKTRTEEAMIEIGEIDSTTGETEETATVVEITHGLDRRGGIESGIAIVITTETIIGAAGRGARLVREIVMTAIRDARLTPRSKEIFRSRKCYNWHNFCWGQHAFIT